MRNFEAQARFLECVQFFAHPERTLMYVNNATGSKILAFGVIAACTGPACANDAGAGNVSSQWVDFNRNVALSAGARQRLYTEFDSKQLTSDGILDEESGRVLAGELSLGWQSHPSNFPIWVQARIAAVSGSTAYRGYLQSGTSLTAFRSTTQNLMLEASARVGMPLQFGQISQIIPYVEVAHHRWRRDLTQYREDYQDSAAGIGSLVQTRLGRLLILQADLSVSHIIDARINVPVFKFNNSVPGKNRLFSGLGMTYQMSPQISVGAQLAYEKYRHAASSVVNGVRLPAARSQNTMLSLRASRHY